MLAAHGFGRKDERYGYIIGKTLPSIGLAGVRMDLTDPVFDNNQDSAEDMYNRGFKYAR